LKIQAQKFRSKRQTVSAFQIPPHAEAIRRLLQDFGACIFDVPRLILPLAVTPIAHYTSLCALRHAKQNDG
jgi:hypothetical protein